MVAKIPYRVAGPVVLRLLEHRDLFDRLVLMVQDEVADRLTGAPGTSDYGSPTPLTHLFADARRVASSPGGRSCRHRGRTAG